MSPISEYKYQFEKENISWYELGIDYDCQSVMHYHQKAGLKSFSKGVTIRHNHNESCQDIMGTATDASPNDYRKLCLLYGCNVCMGRPFSPAANYCPYPDVPREREGCVQSAEKTRNGSRTEFLQYCCQTRSELAQETFLDRFLCDNKDGTPVRREG